MADYLLGGESGDVLFENDFLNFEYESQSSFCRNDCQKKPCNLDTFECQIGRINGAFEFMIFRMILDVSAVRRMQGTQGFTKSHW